MEKTELLYYSAPLMTEFDARVIDTVDAENAFDIVLDRTCFYPEGGGQPADRGTIEGISVTGVRKKDGVVFHRMPKAPEKTEVHGKVDWAHRFDYMQQHTGQHLLSAVLFHKFGYSTVSVHFGEEYASIEIDTETLNPEEIEVLEDEANSLIRKNIPVRETWTTSDNLKGFSLRRDTAVTGDVRIVMIGDYDAVACGGVHCASSGEVGLVKIIGTEKIRGRTRILFKIGGRAYSDYSQKSGITANLCALLSARPEELPDRTAGLLNENTALKQELAALKQEQLLARADRLIRETGPEMDGIRRIGKTASSGDSRDIIEMVKHLIRGGGIHACLVLDRGGDLFWCIGCSEELDFPFTTCRAELLETIDGKGGGKHPLWQGMGRKPEAAERFIDLWKGYTVPLTGAPGSDIVRP